MPMRRALVIAGVMFAGLLAAASASAQADPRFPEREVGFELPAAEGFKALLDTTDNDGAVTATLIVHRGKQIAYYTTPAKITADRVTARFGTLGELDFHFKAKRGGSVRCTGAEGGEAVFDGTFTFTGENDYVHLEAEHAEGSFQVYPEPKGCQDTPSASARRVVPYQPTYSDQGATLRARLGSRAGGAVREVSVADGGGRRRHPVGIYGLLAEAREGMSVSRGVWMEAPSSTFGWSLGKGTATLRPPGPFTGSAHFVRHGTNGHGTWTGSLTMPVLGGEPVRLAGPDFRAFLHKGVQQDE
jgi:hypothetical protein